MYALIENNAITRTTDDLRKEFPNTSFPRPLPDAHEGWVKVTGTPGGNAFQKVASREVVLEDGQPVFSYTYEEVGGAKEAHLATYGKALEDSALTVQGFTEDGTEEHRRNAKEALDFVEELGADAPATIPWSSPNHGVQSVTPAVLKAWLIAAGQRRFKRFAIQAAIDLTDLTTPEEVEAAFDAAYEA